NIVKMYAPVFGCIWVLDENCNGDWGASALTKDVASFFATLLTCCTRVPTQMEDVEIAELFDKTLAHPISGVPVDPARISHIGHDTSIANPFARPTERSDIAVIQ